MDIALIARQVTPRVDWDVRLQAAAEEATHDGPQGAGRSDAVPVHEYQTPDCNCRQAAALLVVHDLG